MLCHSYTRIRRVVLSTFLAGLTSLFVQSASGEGPFGAGEWPGFRGANGDGVVEGSSVFSTPGGFGLARVWKTSIGSGYSGIAIAGGYVVTMFSDDESDVMVGLDEATGKERWRFEIGPTYVGHDGSHTGPISTPLIAGKSVVGLGARGRLFAVNLRSGSLLWSTHLLDDHKSVKPHYGFGTSPIFMDGVVVVQLGAKDGAVAGFDPADGKLLWTVGDDKVNYQSPILMDLHGRRQVIAVGDKKLIGIDARSGSRLWEYEHEGEGARGIWSASPVPAGADRLFMAYKDDSAAVFELTKTGDETTGKRLWDSRTVRNSYNVPIYHDGYVYAFSSRFLTCVDAATGESVWRSRQPGDGFLILVDGHLVIQTKNGSLHVVKATPSGYHEVASTSLFKDLAWSAPSFANGYIFVRSLGEIARVNITAAPAVATAATGPGTQGGGSRFSRLRSEVIAASDKKAVVDRFMAATDQLPLIEGTDLIHFIYRGKADDLAVAGDIFGARQEQAMKRLEGTDLFYYSTRLEPDARVNYLFIKDYEEITDPANPRKTTTTVYKKEMEMSFSGEAMEMSWVSMPSWKAPTHLAETDGARGGRVEEQELDSKVLGKKAKLDEEQKIDSKVSSTKVKLHVYLPNGYDKNKRTYPVAYIHGGGAAREMGSVPTILDNLIGKRMTPIIAVFIDYSPQGDTPKYSEMFSEELIPFIDKTYRTKATPDARANIGMGFAGFSALMCTFAKPGLVDNVGCQSTFMFSSMTGELYPLITDADENPLKIYLDWGKYDLRNPHEAWDLAKTNREFAQVLRKKGYTFEGGEVHDGTGWSSWRNRTDDLFENLFPIRKSRSAG